MLENFWCAKESNKYLDSTEKQREKLKRRDFERFKLGFIKYETVLKCPTLYATYNQLVFTEKNKILYLVINLRL